MLIAGFLALLSLLPPPVGSTPPQWVLVTAPAYRKAIQPLCEHRISQGMRVDVVDAGEHITPEEIRKGEATKLRRQVNEFCRKHKGTSYVLLVGAVEADKDAARTVVPPLAGTAGRERGAPDR